MNQSSLNDIFSGFDTTNLMRSKKKPKKSSKKSSAMGTTSSGKKMSYEEWYESLSPEKKAKLDKISGKRKKKSESKTKPESEIEKDILEGVNLEKPDKEKVKESKKDREKRKFLDSMRESKAVGTTSSGKEMRFKDWYNSLSPEHKEELDKTAKLIQETEPAADETSMLQDVISQLTDPIGPFRSILNKGSKDEGAPRGPLGGILDKGGLLGGGGGGGGLGGSPEEFGKVKTATSEQEQFLKNLYGSGGGLGGNQGFQQGQDFLSRLLSNDPELMKQFEAPYMEQFQQQTVPGLLEKFGSLGTGAGATYGSGLQNSLAQAGRGLQTDLAAMRSGLQQQALPQALSYAQQPVANQLQGLGFSPYDTYHKQAQPGFGDYAMKGGIDALFKYITGGIG